MVVVDEPDVPAAEPVVLVVLVDVVDDVELLVVEDCVLAAAAGAW